MAWLPAFFVIFLTLVGHHPGTGSAAESTSESTILCASRSVGESPAEALLAMAAPPNLDKMIKGASTPAQVGDMVHLPGGYFTMGNHRGRPDERPPHTVHLSPYYIDVLEVTSAEYKEFVDATGRACPSLPEDASPELLGLPHEWGLYLASISHHWAWRDGSPPAGTEEHPVVLVSWQDASAYCAWRGKRLPTEAEWEMAARGSDRRSFPWGDEWDSSFANSAERWTGADRLSEEEGTVWWAGDGAKLASKQSLTLPVASFPEGTSPCGLYDMAGNVAEWVLDWYDPAYYERSVEKDPKGPEEGDLRVVRGGSWFGVSDSVSATARRGVHPSVRSLLIGFRCAKDGD